MNLVKRVTDDFCGAWRKCSDFKGPVARLVAEGGFPEGVDPADIRVVRIQMLCQAVNLLDDLVRSYDVINLAIDKQLDISPAGPLAQALADIRVLDRCTEDARSFLKGATT